MVLFARSLAVAAACAFIATTAPAQEYGTHRQSGLGPGTGPGTRPTEQQREEVRKKVEAVRLARLTEELQLDEKTAAAFIPAITAIDQKRRTLLKENHDTMRDLKIMLHGATPDESKLKAAISAIEKNRREIFALRDREFSTAMSSLTVTQMARYLLFNQEFQQEMRGMVEGARTPRRGGMGPRQGPAKMGPGPQTP